MVDSSKVTAFITALTNKFENKNANKKDTITGDFSSDSTSYPTVKAVKNFFGSKVTSWSSTTSNDNYPSEKLVKDSLDDKISKSSTAGLMRNNGTVDTSTYLTSADISGKEDKSNIVTSTAGWSSTTSDTKYPSEKLVKTDLDKKLNIAQTSNKGKNVVVDSTSGNITFENKPDIPTKTSDLTNDADGTTGATYVLSTDSRLTDNRDPNSHTHGSITNDGKIGSDSGKIITTGTGGVLQASSTITKSKISDFPTTMTPASHTHGAISNSGTIGSDSGKIITTGSGGALQASDSITKSMISDFPSTMTPSAHEQATSTITNSTAYDNILAGESTTLTLTDQAKINAAINTKIGALQGLKFIEITTDKGTASASTMGKLYIESKNSKTDAYYTKNSSGSYSWVKLEDNILEDVDISWSNITGKPSFGTGANDFAIGNHTHGSITNDGKIGSDSGKIITTGTGGALQASSSITKSMISDFSHTHNYTTTSDVDDEIEAYLDAITTALS